MVGARVLALLIACACSKPAAPRAVAAPVVAAPIAAAPAPSAPTPAPAIEPAPPPPTEPVAPPCPAKPRDAYQKPEHILEHLAISPGMTVVDLGAGDGYFVCHLSRAVGPDGRVVATEVGKRLVRALEKRLDGLANVDVVLAPKTDVGVTAADRILLVNVWHHIANRRRYAAKLAKALAPGGRIVIVDFPFNKKSGHGVGHRQALAELAAAGFEATLVDDELANQYVIVATR